LHVIPFIAQDDHDKLLWSCDINFVRGEDSSVRAQWAARPFVWHLYPQSEQAHLAKLRAFTDRYAVDWTPAPRWPSGNCRWRGMVRRTRLQWVPVRLNLAAARPYLWLME
jgi:uncharacterized repeat protein (TIGR03837 family)